VDVRSLKCSAYTDVFQYKDYLKRRAIGEEADETGDSDNDGENNFS